MALLAPLPTAEGWKPRASPAISVKGRKVSARKRGRKKQQYLTTLFSSAVSPLSSPFLNKKLSNAPAPHLQGGKIQFNPQCSRAFRQL